VSLSPAGSADLVAEEAVDGPLVVGDGSQRG
jgi:hypothetical protein